MPDLFPGNVVSFSYPTDNRVQARTRLTPRRLLVERVRDLDREPLDPFTLWLDPWLRRGRHLVIGHDLDRQARRCYYLDSARSLRLIDEPVYRLGTYDRVDGTGVLLRGPVFLDSLEDLAAMRRIMRHAYHLAGDRRQYSRAIGIFAVGESLPRT